MIYLPLTLSTYTGINNFIDETPFLNLCSILTYLFSTEGHWSQLGVSQLNMLVSRQESSVLPVVTASETYTLTSRWA